MDFFRFSKFLTFGIVIVQKTNQIKLIFDYYILFKNKHLLENNINVYSFISSVGLDILKISSTWVWVVDNLLIQRHFKTKYKHLLDWGLKLSLKNDFRLLSILFVLIKAWKIAIF